MRLEREADGFLARAEEFRLAHDAARRQADELAGRLAEAERRHAEAAAEADRLRGEADAARRDAEGEAARRARLEQEEDARRGDTRRTAQALEEAARALEEARGRADAAERIADGLRGEVDRLVRDREADREVFEAELQALRGELDQSRSREAAGRDEAVTLADALAELRRRLDADTGTDADPGGADDLARQLAEARRSNQRLGSLLDVFGLPKELAAGRSGSAAPPDDARTPSSRPSPLPG